jgi:hypothetical protein
MADIFDEVSEDLRRERLKKLWDRFAPLLIGLVAVIVIGIGGWRFWEHYQGQQRAASGDRYNAAMQLADQGKHEDAAAAFTTLSEDGSAGYRTLGRMRAASEMALRDPKAAIAAYDAFAADSSEPAGLRDVARLRAGYLTVDGGTFAEAQNRVGALAVAGNPLRHSAREILGLAAWKNGNTAEARKWLQDMVADPEAASGFRQRGELVLGMIASGEAPPAPVQAPAPAGEAPTPPPMPEVPVLPPESSPAPSLPGIINAPLPETSNPAGEPVPANPPPTVEPLPATPPAAADAPPPGPAPAQ